MVYSKPNDWHTVYLVDKWLRWLDLIMKFQYVGSRSSLSIRLSVSLALSLSTHLWISVSETSSYLLRTVNCTRSRCFIKNYRFCWTSLRLWSCYAVFFQSTTFAQLTENNRLIIFSVFCFFFRKSRDTRSFYGFNFLLKSVSLSFVRTRCASVWRSHIKSHENQFTCKI